MQADVTIIRASLRRGLALTGYRSSGVTAPMVRFSGCLVSLSFRFVPSLIVAPYRRKSMPCGQTGLIQRPRWALPVKQRIFV
jgi:hypothetical protein